jgi:hypothetical protein
MREELDSSKDGNKDMKCCLFALWRSGECCKRVLKFEECSERQNLNGEK